MWANSSQHDGGHVTPRPAPRGIDMSRNQIRYRVALPTALVLIPLAAGPVIAHPERGDLSITTATAMSWDRPMGQPPVLPGDLRLRDDAHLASASPAPLPGDVRVWEAAHPASASRAPLP